MGAWKRRLAKGGSRRQWLFPQGRLAEAVPNDIPFPREGGMGSIFIGQPVGWPGVAALGVGGAAFFAILLRTRLGAGSRDAGDKSSPRSAAGIVLQMLAFAGTGIGRVIVALPPTGLKAMV